MGTNCSEDDSGMVIPFKVSDTSLAVDTDADKLEHAEIIKV